MIRVFFFGITAYFFPNLQINRNFAENKKCFLFNQQAFSSEILIDTNAFLRLFNILSSFHTKLSEYAVYLINHSYYDLLHLACQ